MALLAMAVYDTDENKRTDYTKDTITSLTHSVDWLSGKHRLIVIDNASCKATKDYLEVINDVLDPEYRFTVITLEENIGTAEAINLAIKTRKPGENVIKMDNDVVIHNKGWIEYMEECIVRDPNIGIIGLKRKDLWENPNHEDPNFKSKLLMLPHKVGEKWLVVEQVNHVIGTCQMYSSAFLDKIGYLIQPGLYGFDDSLAAYRCHMAGFKSVFIPHIHIDHIDVGGDNYYGWKQKEADKGGPVFQKMKDEYLSGERDIYYNPFTPKVNQPVEYKMPDGNIARIKVVTTASDPNHPGLKQFERSLKFFNVPYHIIIHEWKGFGSKMIETYNYLKRNPDKLTHFVYADTYDSFVLGSMYDICDQIKDWDAILFQAEKACYPKPELQPKYPTHSSQWKYLNGGGWVAPVDDFLRMVENDFPALDVNDQAWSTDQFLKYHDTGAIKLDYKCSIFQSIAFEHETDFTYLWQNDKYGNLINLETKSFPIIFHGNGHTPMEKIYALLPEVVDEKMPEVKSKKSKKKI